MTVRRLLIAVLVIVLLLAGAQLWLQRYAQARLDALLSQTRSWAQISVGRAHFWIWGVADLRDITVTPAAWYGAAYGLPLGYSVSIDRLRVHHLRPSFDGGLHLASADAELDGVQLPLPDWRWTITVARGADGHRLYAPTLADLGLKSLDFDAHLHGNFSQGMAQPSLQLTSFIAGLARIRGDCSLSLAGAALRSPDAVSIRRCSLRYDDDGLAQRFELEMAKRNQLPLAGLQQAINRQIALDAGRARWPPLNTQAVQAFIRKPGALLLTIEPPQPLPLDRIPRVIWPGLPAYLGLAAEQPAAVAD